LHKSKQLSIIHKSKQLSLSLDQVVPLFAAVFFLLDAAPVFFAAVFFLLAATSVFFATFLFFVAAALPCLVPVVSGADLAMVCWS